MTKSYRIVRQSPTDLDDSGNITPSLQFDYRHKGGATPWPERHKFSGVKFGPALIKRAWREGLMVVAYIEGFPNPVAVTETRWNEAKCFEVKTLEGWRLPKRIRTLTDTKGLMSTGEWIE
jgi:hypothetical protein